MGPREVFLSHSHQDRAFASRLAETLGRHGVPVWYSRERIQVAQQWHDEIGKALRRCDWFALVLSPSAVGSGWVRPKLLFGSRSGATRSGSFPSCAAAVPMTACPGPWTACN